MISVCIATYNGEKFIRQQIESILPQIDKYDEIIISDDGSTDSTIAILKSFEDSRIKIFHNDLFHGVNGNFENALKHSNGDYIFLADQDNVWTDNKIQTCLNSLKKYDCVLHNGYVTDENLVIQTNQIGNTNIGEFSSNLFKNNFTGCCMAFKSNILETILPIPKTKLFYYDQWIGLMCQNKFNTQYLPEQLIYLRRHSETASTVSNKSSRSIFTKIRSRIFLLVNIIFK